MEANENEIKQQLTSNGQICKNIKGRPLTKEERAEKQARTKKQKERKAKIKLQKERKLLESTTEQKSEFFDEESDIWVEEVVAPLPIELQDEEDTYVPPITTSTQKKQRTQQNETIEEQEQPIQLKPIPSIGTSITNPLVNDDIYGVLERLYSEIGYFILAEQVISYHGQRIKVILLKLDDGRAVNFFATI